MIIGFFRVKFLALQNEDWFLSSKNQSKKHLLQNDKPGVCNKMHFTSPFFFYQFRVRSHSVVSISSPFLWWKFKGGSLGVFSSSTFHLTNPLKSPHLELPLTPNPPHPWHNDPTKREPTLNPCGLRMMVKRLTPFLLDMCVCMYVFWNYLNLYFRQSEQVT